MGHLPRQPGADKMSGHSKGADLGMFCQEKSLRIPAPHLSVYQVETTDHGLSSRGIEQETVSVGWSGDSNQVLQLF